MSRRRCLSVRCLSVRMNSDVWVVYRVRGASARCPTVLGAHTAVLLKIPHCNSSKSDPNRPLRGRRGRFGALLQQLECGIFERTAVPRRGSFVCCVGTTPGPTPTQMVQPCQAHGGRVGPHGRRRDGPGAGGDTRRRATCWRHTDGSEDRRWGGGASERGRRRRRPPARLARLESAECSAGKQGGRQ